MVGVPVFVPPSAKISLLDGYDDVLVVDVEVDEVVVVVDEVDVVVVEPEL